MSQNVPSDNAATLPTPLPATSKPKRAVGPRLRVVLVVVLTMFSLLAANGIYLASVTFIQWWREIVIEDYFYQIMVLAHLVLGFVFTVPVIVFGLIHWNASRNRRNKRAIRIGYALFAIAIVVLLSGVFLTRIGSFEFASGPFRRQLIYWAHVTSPLLAVWLYWLHRLVGPTIKWYVGRRIAIATAVCVGAMIMAQMQDPRDWNKSAPKEGAKYFEPSLARTRTGNFIPAAVLQNDEYCKKCHEDAYNDWFHSAHRFSSFNNPAYLYAVRDTRKAVNSRDGSIQASRWCAGCHDPVPFFSGAFDDPNYDDVNHPTSQAGITCTTCHAITHVNSVRGNADYVIEEPVHYPFAYSKNPVLQKVNELLVKAKPGFHKKEMLKPLHKDEAFCSTCHKVHLPKALTNYRDFLRGQNHHDSYLLSGVAGHGARSFYYPKKAETNCNGCHMEFKESNDIAAREVDGKRVVHDHFFAGGNTALPYWRGDMESVKREQKILEGCARVDIFGLRKDGQVFGDLMAPIGPSTPTLVAGETYLLETIIRTLKLGHHLTQGTVDSNELWLEVTVKAGDRLIGASGKMDDRGEVDPWAHFVNNFVIDRNGNRIIRRNPQDIFTAVYNHQIPPGAGQIAHYRLQIPEDVVDPVTIEVEFKYRKFAQSYIDYMNSSIKPGDRPFKNGGTSGNGINELPITVIAKDKVVLPVQRKDGTVATTDFDNDAGSPDLWQRWNDYGIGLLLTGNAQLRQAEEAFQEVEKLGRFDGPLNIGRVLLAEGNLNGATEALARAEKMDPPPPAWTLAWLSGEVAIQQGQFELAEKLLRSVLYDQTQERIERDFDFSKDYIVRNSYGGVLIDLADKAAARKEKDQAIALLERARKEFETVTNDFVDPENNTAWANLREVYSRLADFATNEKDADELMRLSKVAEENNIRYKPDDNAADIAIPKARQKYPAADHAAERVVIYDLHRKDSDRDAGKNAGVDRTGKDLSSLSIE